MSENGSKKTPPKRSETENTNPQPQDRFETGYDFLLINHDIDHELFQDVFECVTTQRKNAKVVIILVTYGGSANVAYRIGRLLQTVYDEVVVFIPSLCKSAGTLLVAAAHSVIVMGFGELGPLDVQQSKRDEIWGRRSGLTTRSALLDLKDQSFELFEHFLFGIISRSRGSVSFRLASDIAAKATAEMMSPIYSQINPEALGQDFMDLSVAEKYCERLGKQSNNLKAGAIHRLVYEYPSHDFVIDFEEAKEIFDTVELPTQTILDLLEPIDQVMRPKPGRQGIVKMLHSPVKPLDKSPSKPLDQKENADTQRKGEQNADRVKVVGRDSGGASTAARGNT